MNLPKQYEWLLKEPGPKMLIEALKLYGIHEVLGPGNNPIILQWAKEIGVEDVYKSDEVPWCSLFMSVVAKRAGKEIPDKPLWALNWANFGSRTNTPMLGDVLTFTRKLKDGSTAGHIGIYVAESNKTYHVLAGNQGDQVSIVEILKLRLYQARRPAYTNQPSNVRKVFMEGGKLLSTNEQ